MCSVDTWTNILTLPSSSWGTITKPTSRRSCRTFISIYPAQPEDRIHSIIATPSSKMPTKLVPCRLLPNRTMPPFSSHRNTNNGSSRTPGGEGSDALVLPLWSYATGVSWWRRLGHVPGEFIWRQRVHGCSIKLYISIKVRRELKRVNVRKAAGPDGITGHVLRSCADQLAGLFTFIFNESLATSVVPTSFKKSVIIPVPKNSKPSCLNDYRPVALTSTVMKVFERLLKNHICSSIPATLDPLQFAYRPNRSTDDAISQVLHSSLTHIDSKNGNYVRLLFIDYSSAFNTIVPTKLAVKLSDLGITSSLCDWIQDFLTARPQVEKVGQFTSNSITLNVGAPQGCVLSPLLYSLYTHNCLSSHSSTSIVKFADDTVVLGFINNNDEAAYLDEVERLTSWCQDNCLSLNVSKTKELIVDFRKRQQQPYTPLMISETPVERVSSF